MNSIRTRTLDGSEVEMLPSAVELLREQIAGGVILPDDREAYERTRHVWNALIDRHPAMIVRCTGTADVVSAVRFARERNLLTAVRGGGHDVSGNATCDGGMMIDLSRMKGIRVDPALKTVRAGPGVTWAELDRETQVFDLATTGSMVSSTGISGFTLGGGIGWLMRRFGLTCDNLASSDVVTADGDVVVASPTENAELFWGLRGGGGNFGVVTSYEYRLHHVGPVLGGFIIYPFDRAREVLRLFRDYTARVPDNLTAMATLITAPPVRGLPENVRGAPVAALAFCWTGNIAEGNQIVRPLREFGPPIADLSAEMSYPALQSMHDASAPEGSMNFWKSGCLSELDDETIELIVTHAARMPSRLSHVDINQMGGIVSRISEDRSAFSHRDAAFIMNIVAAWTDRSENERQMKWTRDFWREIRPRAKGTYLNFLADGEDEESVTAAFSPKNLARLAALKRKFDPANVFRMNHNIRPG